MSIKLDNLPHGGVLYSNSNLLARVSFLCTAVIQRLFRVASGLNCDWEAMERQLTAWCSRRSLSKSVATTLLPP